MKYQTASQSNLPPVQDDLLVDPLVLERTRFSPDRRHRYTLFRRFEGRSPNYYLAVIGMNPSGADAHAVDRTVAKCMRFAFRWGFGALYMLNAFALRATNSDELYQVPDPIGPENDRWLCEITAGAGLVVVAWGRPGGTLGRGAEVEAILRQSCRDKVVCFGRNKDGTPVHPLYQLESLKVEDLLPFF